MTGMGPVLGQARLVWAAGPGLGRAQPKTTGPSVFGGWISRAVACTGWTRWAATQLVLLRPCAVALAGYKPREAETATRGACRRFHGCGGKAAGGKS